MLFVSASWRNRFLQCEWCNASECRYFQFPNWNHHSRSLLSGNKMNHFYVNIYSFLYITYECSNQNPNGRVFSFFCSSQPTIFIIYIHIYYYSSLTIRWKETILFIPFLFSWKFCVLWLFFCIPVWCFVLISATKCQWRKQLSHCVYSSSIQYTLLWSNTEF